MHIHVWSCTSGRTWGRRVHIHRKSKSRNGHIYFSVPRTKENDRLLLVSPQGIRTHPKHTPEAPHRPPPSPQRPCSAHTRRSARRTPPARRVRLARLAPVRRCGGLLRKQRAQVGAQSPALRERPHLRARGVEARELQRRAGGQRFTVLCGALRQFAVLCGALRGASGALRCSAVLCGALRCSAVLRGVSGALRCSVML